MGETLESLAGLVDVPESPVDMCRISVDSTGQTLARYGVDYTPVEGAFHGREVPGGEGQSIHWYIIIPGTELDDVADGARVIVDPTVHQFTESNYDAGDVDTYIPSDALPDRPVIPEQSSLHGAYREATR